jgi:hypothetical protein
MGIGTLMLLLLGVLVWDGGASAPEGADPLFPHHMDILLFRRAASGGGVGHDVTSGGLPTRPARPGLEAPKARGPQSGGSSSFAGSVAPKCWCPQSLEVPKDRGPKDWRPPWVGGPMGWGPHGLGAPWVGGTMGWMHPWVGAPMG